MVIKTTLSKEQLDEKSDETALMFWFRKLITSDTKMRNSFRPNDPQSKRVLFNLLAMLRHDCSLLQVFSQVFINIYSAIKTFTMTRGGFVFNLQS